MLLIAPVVIMTVAGYSLGAIYGPATRVVLAVVDHDGGEVRRAAARDAGRRSASGARRPRGGTAAHLQSGRRRSPSRCRPDAAAIAGRLAALVLYVDPARRLEVDALELELGVVQRRAAADARIRVQRRIREQARDLRHALRHLRAPPPNASAA